MDESNPTQIPDPAAAPKAAEPFVPSGLSGGALHRSQGFADMSFRAPEPQIGPSGLKVRSGTERVVEIYEVVELEASDLAELDANGSFDTNRSIKQLRTTHHAIARYIVAGLSFVEIHRITGYSPQTVDRLRNSPAFVELMEHYKTEANVETAKLRRNIEHLGEMSLERLQELLESDQPLDPEWVQKVAFNLLDRLGHGPVTTQRSEYTERVIHRHELVAIKRVINEQQQSRPERRAVEAVSVRTESRDSIESSGQGDRRALPAASSPNVAEDLGSGVGTPALARRGAAVA